MDEQRVDEQRVVPQARRVIDAALRCIGRWGVAKTSLDDIAREAGYSRATVYRLFPGGKDALIDEVTAAELSRFFASLGARLDAAESLEDVLVDGITCSARFIAGHGALQFLLAHEPETILPRICFAPVDRVLGTVRAFGAPYLERWVGPEQAPKAAEWVARIVLSYTLSPADDVDLADEESVRRLVRSFVLPGLLAPVPA